MIGKLARGAFLLTLAALVAAYVMSAATAKAPEPAPGVTTWIWC